MAGSKKGRKNGIILKMVYCCKQCGKLFYDWKSNQRIFCSRSCRLKSLSQRYKGEGGPTWKGGYSNTNFYKRWASMLRRCFNPSQQSYKNYGGRGITVCKEWLSFEGFRKDMEEGFQEDLTLDRIDVNGNYCKQNCRWSTWKEQANNKRNSKLSINYG